MSSALVVAIDGPSGVGKSTVARRVAARLGIPFLDTGAMYRALGLAVAESGIDPDDHAAVARLAATADVALAPSGDGALEVRLDGEAVESRIRDPRIGDITSRIAALPEVRRRLVALQRATALRHGGVLEGRDIGTQVVPETPHKFYFDARAEVRVSRRVDQLRESGRTVDVREVEEELSGRDWRDSHREASPLRCDASYQRIDTSELSIDEVVERIVDAVRARIAPVGG